MDTDRVKSVLEAVIETLKGLQTPEPVAAPEVDYGYDGKKHSPVVAKCVAPHIVIYVILTECVTINNGACREWQFCAENFLPTVR